MPKKRLGAEQIVTKLRQIEVLQGQGKSLAVACKEVGTTEYVAEKACRIASAIARLKGGSAWRRRIRARIA